MYVLKYLYHHQYIYSQRNTKPRIYTTLEPSKTTIQGSKDPLKTQPRKTSHPIQRQQKLGKKQNGHNIFPCSAEIHCIFTSSHHYFSFQPTETTLSRFSYRSIHSQTIRARQQHTVLTHAYVIVPHTVHLSSFLHTLETFNTKHHTQRENTT